MRMNKYYMQCIYIYFFKIITTLHYIILVQKRKKKQSKHDFVEGFTTNMIFIYFISYHGTRTEETLG